MMYSSGFVVCIVCNGRVLEESKDGIVRIPFGAEYSIRLRNKNNRRAVAFLQVDDENAGGNGIIIDYPGNYRGRPSYVDVKGPIGTEKNFKFVSSQSGETVDAGKNNKVDGSNGVIRVEFKLEKPTPPPTTYWRSDNYERDLSFDLRGHLLGFGSSETRRLNATEPTCSIPLDKLQEGCTVEGGYSGQKWQTEYLDIESGIGVVIQLKLMGYNTNSTNTKVSYCDNCGQKVNKRSRFCSNCGSKLKNYVR
jgi:hypothetical protein